MMNIMSLHLKYPKQYKNLYNGHVKNINIIYESRQSYGCIEYSKKIYI